MEEGLYKYYPQTKGKVEFTEVGSPLTFNHYLGSVKGEVYGANATPNRFQPNDLLRPKTSIENFYLTRPRCYYIRIYWSNDGWYINSK